MSSSSTEDKKGAAAKTGATTGKTTASKTTATGSTAGKVVKKKVAKKAPAPTTAKKTVARKTAVPRKKAPAGGRVTAATLKRVDPRERYEMIAKMAYFRAEKRGFEPGWEMEDWLECERLVDEMLKNM